MEKLKGIPSTEGYEDDLIRELLDNESPLFMPYQEPSMETNSTTSSSSDSTINPLLVSALHSSPTLQDDDIERALSYTNYEAIPEACRLIIYRFCRFISLLFFPFLPSLIFFMCRTSLMMERGLNKEQESKYSMRIKCCGNVMADDGYKWRKYGQKSIKNSPHPR